MCKELLRNAAKARIARMVASKKKRTDLEVPSWIKEQWAKGTQAKEEMAAALQEVNWSKARFQMFVYLITSCFSFFFLLLLLLNRFVLLFCSLFLVFFFSIYSVSSSSSSSSSFSSYVLFLSCAGVWMLVVVAVALCASWGCCFLASFWPVFGVLLLLLLQW